MIVEKEGNHIEHTSDCDKSYIREYAVIQTQLITEQIRIINRQEVQMR